MPFPSPGASAEPSSHSLPDTIELLAWVGGAVVTFLVPLVFLAISYHGGAERLDGALAALELDALKHGVAESPAYAPQRMVELLAGAGEATTARVTDAGGELLAERQVAFIGPAITRTATLHHADGAIWEVEVRRDILPLLMYSLVMFVPGLLLGRLCFSLLLALPTRAFQFALQEIAQRKATEERLAKSLSLFSATLESTADGILVTDSCGRPVVSNRRFLDMWGIQETIRFDGDLAQPLASLVAQVRNPAAFIARQKELNRELGVNHVESLELRDGRNFEWYSRPQHVDGEVVGRVSSYRDISERKRAEALLAAEKQVLELVVSGAPLGDALGVLAGHVEMLSGQMFCAIIFREPDQEAGLFCATGPGLPAIAAAGVAERGHAALARVFAEIGQRGLVGSVLEDVGTRASWTDYRRMISGWGVHAGFAAPIASSEGPLLGVIVAHYRDPDDRQAHDVELIRVATNLTSIAIERRQAEARLDVMAHYDGLTGLPNRVLFRDRLHHALSRAERDKSMVAVMFLDLDRFKVINDTLGHDAGDVLLKEAAARLRSCVREQDTVARLGGDEFTFVLEGIARPDDAALVGRKIVDALAPPIVLCGQEAYVTPSIGITIYPSDSDQFDLLLNNADTAMYQAKGEGGNGFRFFTPEMNARAQGRLQLEIGLRHALERDEFLVYYQPKVDIASGAIIGAEALLRWKHPEWGLVSPVEFIPILEETGLIEPVGEWVLKAACTQVRAWQAAGLPPLGVAVNLSGRQLQRNNLALTIAGILEETGLHPDFLELEVTESMLMQDPHFATEMLAQIRTKGVVNIAVDDFGTGYSSLSYLKQFPIDGLKLDKSFVKGLPSDREDIAIATAVIALAHGLDLVVVAEGVETVEQFAFLRRSGCDIMQGYLVSPPLPAEDFERLVRRGWAGSGAGRLVSVV